MVEWNEFKPITEYQTDWKGVEEKSALTNLFDNLFGWVNDALSDQGRYLSIDKQQEQILKDSPEYGIKRYDDSYELEAEKLIGIQQRSSRGFQIIDINPGLLNSLDNPLTLPYEFIFDGTNFMPDQSGNFVKNFRTVNIPIAGNFLKIEYIYENNDISNIGYSVSGASPIPNILRPNAEIKYQQAFGNQSLGETDLITGQTNYTFDHFARNKVYVDFGANTGKPHLVPTSGRVFKTYYNEVNISLNIGCPKIRVTLGFNSEVYEASNTSSINAKLALTGGARLLNDSDTVLNPFCFTDQDASIDSMAGPPGGLGIPMTANVAAQATYRLISNLGFLNTTNSAGNFVKSFGYSVLWITRIYFKLKYNPIPTEPNFNYFRINLKVDSYTLPVVGTISQAKTIHNASIGNEYIFQPSEPIRVVIPVGSALFLKLSYVSNVNTVGLLSFSIDGYSYGEILKFPLPNGSFYPTTSKFITDSSFVSDFNRIYSLKDP